MRTPLMLAAAAVLASMIAVSTWATLQQPIGAAISDLARQPGGGNNPWFIATLFDAYFGFLWFWAWIAYKETSIASRGLWLVLILGLGNIAMASYVLVQLWKLPAGAKVEGLLLRNA